ncbi:hypothetical protein MAPG_05367 [Magnaporthiopsis poae ATCC 64411]|uniref:Integral membrane protein n=1 Tax=Magnaporthiopsis poae (strain ATCC 64411 / 73-15) TaxID=644358 RepID=A0A0C4DZ75_MAGP6|nr:hypothetical protein MAPG_05367 [Magnaporthiopsis poae ATCC 64411]
MATILVLALAMPASETSGRPRPGVRKRWVRIAAVSGYYFLVSGAMAVQLVEMVRLTQAQLGVSMIPFSVVGALLAVASVAAGERLPTRRATAGSAAAVFWAAGAVITGAKVAALRRFIGDEEGSTGPLARQGTIYPVADQMVDNAALAGVYAALVAVELVLGLVVLPSVSKIEGAPGTAHIELADK